FDPAQILSLEASQPFYIVNVGHSEPLKRICSMTLVFRLVVQRLGGTGLFISPLVHGASGGRWSLLVGVFGSFRMLLDRHNDRVSVRRGTELTIVNTLPPACR